MNITSKILRTIALALLSGGSASIVFAAITLVKAATANGASVSDAATANAPIFIAYSHVALTAALALALAEIWDFLFCQKKELQNNSNKTSKLVYLRYISSFICIASVAVFALFITPPMKDLLPNIKMLASAQEEFHRLHEISRIIFGTSILFAFISLILPCFQKKIATSSSLQN